MNSFGWESNTYELFVSEGMRVAGCPGPCLLNERGLGGSVLSLDRGYIIL